MHLEIDRRDIHSFRLAESTPPEQLAEGQVVLRLERAALTSNTVSYALTGDMLDYWGFFPTEAGWGRLPVMGFGVVTASANPDIAVGSRYFGFYPLGDHHVVQARASRGGFVDVATWRNNHAMAYRNFDLVEAGADDDAILIFRGLFVTSFLIDDYLREHNYFGAGRVIITSASSKTSIALAHCLRTAGSVEIVGLTSERNVEFTRGVGEYDTVVSYEEIGSLDDTASVLVDMAGNTNVVAAVHTHLAGKVAYSCSVGATHWDAPRYAGEMPAPTPEFFFAPTQLAKRGKEWGAAEMNEKIAAALGEFIGSTRSWLSIERTVGASAVPTLYSSLVNGNVQPELGHIVTFS